VVTGGHRLVLGDAEEARYKRRFSLRGNQQDAICPGMMGGGERSLALKLWFGRAIVAVAGLV
jgi:hypothetical protein